MVIEYFVNFCDDGNCADGPIRCTYPEIKIAPLQNLFNQTLVGEIEKLVIEVDARDKFNYIYPEGSIWDCTVWAGEQELCHQTEIITSHFQDLSFTITNLSPALNLQDGMPISCKLLANGNNACPYALSLLVYTKEGT